LASTEYVTENASTGVPLGLAIAPAAICKVSGPSVVIPLIEDPATIWNLGPQRYPQIAARYQAVTPHAEKLGRLRRRWSPRWRRRWQVRRP
jgi:hypothetical protein